MYLLFNRPLSFCPPWHWAPLPNQRSHIRHRSRTALLLSIKWNELRFSLLNWTITFLIETPRSPNEDGSSSARSETGDANGRITGFYIIKGADETGFQWVQLTFLDSLNVFLSCAHFLTNQRWNFNKRNWDYQPRGFRRYLQIQFSIDRRTSSQLGVFWIGSICGLSSRAGVVFRSN